MGRSGIHVCPTVDQERNSVLCRNKRCQRRSFNSFDPANDHLTSYKDRSAASCRNKRICFFLLNHIHTFYDRRIFFPANCHDRRFGRFDHFFGMHDLQPFFWKGVFWKLGFDHRLSSRQVDKNIFSGVQCFYGTFDDFSGCVVSAHGIYNHPDHILHSFSSCCNS